MKVIAGKGIGRRWFLLVLCGTATLVSGNDSMPDSMAWAYLHTARGVALQGPPPTAVIRVPGSSLELSGAQFQAITDSPDWFPGDHPVMPEVVAKSRPAGGIACADCHLPNGLGHLGTAVLAGLPAPYLVEQLNAFRDDLRQSAERRLQHTRKMNTVAKGLAPDDIRVAADYFSRQRGRGYGSWRPTACLAPTLTLTTGSTVPPADGWSRSVNGLLNWPRMNTA